MELSQQFCPGLQLKTPMTNIAKIANVTKFQTQKKKEAKKDPEISQVSRIFFLLAKNTRDKYRKNKKSNENQDLEKEEAKKGPEMSANIAKIEKVTRIFHVS